MAGHQRPAKLHAPRSVDQLHRDHHIRERDGARTDLATGLHPRSLAMRDEAATYWTYAFFFRSFSFTRARTSLVTNPAGIFVPKGN